ncbi:uncharacterized protein LAESUDRAFT_717588 [Laetiporus sulphureus 93-53]|uniref:Uncharacterized protein n=1 Tax=Laetiporus sulphureus 93-53 TaxID=1314785 RepID=A0A165BLE6_9APHY|nr:uncharacterized protein LAESUDRAFT_717588 [Laetiporus sulphureus 93-53]KZT01266.1 hypothetical protein LAESUDRAFT_717588 [Laetiporus sulphureus 93-53]
MCSGRHIPDSDLDGQNDGMAHSDKGHPAAKQGKPIAKTMTKGQDCPKDHQSPRIHAEAAPAPSASTHHGPSDIGKIRQPHMCRNEREGAAEEANEEDDDEDEDEGDCEDEVHDNDEGDSGKDDDGKDNSKNDGKDNSKDDIKDSDEDDDKHNIEDGDEDNGKHNTENASSKNGGNDDGKDDAENLLKHESWDEAEREGDHELGMDGDQVRHVKNMNAAKRNQRLIASRHKGVTWESFASDDGADNKIDDEDPVLSDTSGSNFSKTCRVALKKRAQLMHKNLDEALDTDEEDCEIDAELEDELQASCESEEGPDSHPADTYQEKGKSHADLSDYANADDDAIFSEDDEGLGSAISDADGDDDDDSDGIGDGPEKTEKWAKTLGPFSKATKELAEDLGHCVMTEAEDITCQFGKGTHDVLIHANLGIKASRIPNHFNMFHTWYSDHHPFAQAGNDNNMMDKAYRKLCESIKGDDNARECTFKLIFDYCNNLKKDFTHAIHSVKSTTARMICVHKQFTNLAGTYHNLENMEIIGVIIHTGTDTVARQLFTLFGGSQYVMSLIEKNKINVVKLLDDLTTAVKNVKLGQGCTNILFVGGPGINVESTAKESPRDRHRHILMSIMQGSLSLYSDMKNLQHVPWKNWLNFTYKHNLTMFEFKSLNTEELRKLVKGFLQREKSGATSLPIPHVKRWSKSDLEMSDDNLGKDDIPLVISPTGTKHKTLSDVITVKSENEHLSSSSPRLHIPTTHLTRIITIKSDDESPSPLLHCCDVPTAVPHMANMHIDVKPHEADEAVRASHPPSSKKKKKNGACLTPSEAVKAKIIHYDMGTSTCSILSCNLTLATGSRWGCKVSSLPMGTHPGPTCSQMLMQGNAIADSSCAHDNISYPRYNNYLFDPEHEDYLSSNFEECRHTGNK